MHAINDMTSEFQKKKKKKLRYTGGRVIKMLDFVIGLVDRFLDG